MGPIYGKQWRKWKTEKFKKFFNKYGYEDEKRIYIDQIANLINDLKTNPDSRRLMVTAWNPADLEESVLPPCHYGFQVYTRELSEDERNEIRDMRYFNNRLHQEITGRDTKIDLGNIPTRAISLMFNMRSNDVPLGLPFNLASYGLLLEILAKQVNMVPDELIANLGDAHIYLNQINGVKEQLTREPFELPTLNQFPTYEGSRPSIESYTIGDFTLKNYKSHPSIKMPLSN
jgi:thymidylate synthase